MNETCIKAPKKRYHYVDSSDSDSDANVLPKSTKRKKTCNAEFAGLARELKLDTMMEYGTKEPLSILMFSIDNGKLNLMMMTKKLL